MILICFGTGCKILNSGGKHVRKKGEFALYYRKIKKGAEHNSAVCRKQLHKRKRAGKSNIF